MAAYFAGYADTFALRKRIAFRTTVQRLEPEPDGDWRATLHDRTRRRYHAIVIASGRHWAPSYPDSAGDRVPWPR
jgi:cation diffusion facilitator CzcD-associated flavoprotein CzcO